MGEQKPNIKELRSGLSSNDANIVINTLQQVRNAGSKVLIPELVALLRNSRGSEVKTHVLTILNNLKYQSSAGELVKAIRNEQDPEVVALLVAACWKNGLDYSDYIDDFVDIFMRYDYTTALDALTVIENATRELQSAATGERIQKLKARLDESEENKKRLTMELIHTLQQKISE